MQFRKRMHRWYVAMPTALAMLSVASGAGAAIDVVNFTVSPGKWVHDSFPPGWPWGLPPNPALTGQVTIDTSLTGPAAFTALDYVTGTKTWTLTDLQFTGRDTTYSTDSAGNLTGFILDLGPITARNVVAAGVTAGHGFNNTVDLNDGVNVIDCLSCVTTDVPTIIPGPPPGVPEPSAWALLITGVGLLGLALRRRFGPIAANA